MWVRSELIIFLAPPNFSSFATKMGNEAVVKPSCAETWTHFCLSDL